MKVNLRKAAKIQGEIRSTINQQKLLVGLRSLDVFSQDVVGDVNNIQAGGTKALGTIQVLYRILYNIRAAVHKENAKVGIGDLMAKLECDKNILSYLKSAESEFVYTNIDSIQAKIKHTLNKDTDSYIGPKFFVHSVNNERQDSVKDYIKLLTRQVSNTGDELAVLNSACFIDIEEEDYNFLEVVGIV